MEGLTIRPATPEDQQRVAEIVGGDPTEEVARLIGNRRLAREVSIMLNNAPQSTQNWRHSTVAELDGKIVGVIQGGTEIGEPVLTWVDVWNIMRIAGPLRLFAMARRFNARRRVHHEVPPGTWHVAEIDVDPKYQGRGVGRALLGWAEEQARAQGVTQMSLTTHANNPARRLYERQGYHVADTKTDPEFERYTGIRGRHLMLKDLT